MSEARTRLRAPTLESLFVASFALLGIRLLSVPIVDNSTLVHLRTGIDIVAGGGIPRTDPYSFTAAGDPWVVQSWLAATTYGLLERAGGFGWVAAFNGVLAGALAWTMVHIARTGRTVTTALAGLAVVAIGVDAWDPRPLLFGLLAFAVVVLVVDRRGPAWLLVPVVWVWVNTHGSFPLGLVWLGAVVVGAAIDAKSWRGARPLLRYAGWFVAGLVGAAVNPLGPKLLAFSVTLSERQEVFKSIVEWKSPNFQRPGGVVTIVGIVLVLVIVSRSRPRWCDLLPLAVFLALALVAARNLPMLAVAAAPVVGRALRRPDLGPVPGGGRGAVNWGFAAVLALAGAVFLGSAATGPGLDLGPYPTDGLRWIDDNGRFAASHRVVAQDAVGCLIVLREGRSGRVFIDDRFDMYPVRVSQDYQQLLAGEPTALRILDRYRIDTVLWQTDKPLVSILRATGDWRRAFEDGEFVVLTRR